MNRGECAPDPAEDAFSHLPATGFEREVALKLFGLKVLKKVIVMAPLLDCPPESGGSRSNPHQIPGIPKRVRKYSCFIW